MFGLLGRYMFSASQEEASRYTRHQLKLGLLSAAVDLAFLLLFGFVAAGPLAATVAGITGNAWLQVLLFGAAMITASAVVSLPMAFISGYLGEHKFGLSNETLAAWFVKQLKMFGLTLVMVEALFVGLYATIWTLGANWWIAATIGWLLVTVVIGQIFAIALVPLFYKVEKVNDPDLLARFERLAKPAGISITEVSRLNASKDTKKANAFISGMGSAKRVMLFDTLLDSFTRDEIEVVFAHEVGHQAHGHVKKGIIIEVVFTAVSLFICSLVAGHLAAAQGAAGISSIASLPAIMLVLSVFGLVSRPLQHAITRVGEREADWYALEQTGKTEAFCSAFERLGSLNKAEKDPPKWIVALFMSHPPIVERIAMAERWKQARGK